VGVASVGFDLDGKIFFAKQLFWNTDVLKNRKDKKGKLYGQKMTTLEALGFLVPLVTIPEKLKNQHIVMLVDNISCVFAMENCKSSTDESASIIVKAAHLVAARLGSYIHVRHKPRMSSWDAELADRMSREKSTTKQDRKLLDSFHYKKLPSCISQWMSDPKEDWDLPEKILSYVESRL
jgi:hypothetical protein